MPKKGGAVLEANGHGRKVLSEVDCKLNLCWRETDRQVFFHPTFPYSKDHRDSCAAFIQSEASTDSGTTLPSSVLVGPGCIVIPVHATSVFEVNG